MKIYTIRHNGEILGYALTEAIAQQSVKITCSKQSEEEQLKFINSCLLVATHVMVEADHL